MQRRHSVYRHGLYRALPISVYVCEIRARELLARKKTYQRYFYIGVSQLGGEEGNGHSVSLRTSARCILHV